VEKPAEELARIYGNQRWIIATQAAVSAKQICRRLTEWGSDVLVVASNEGTGDLPDAPIFYTGSKGSSALGSIREFYASVESPSAAVRQAVDRFDPSGNARVIAEPHATAMTMLGRATFGVRRPTWSAWEDKMRVDQLWDDIDIARSPFRIVPIEDARAAADDLATELGTVWAADNTDGWHGGSELVSWVSGPDRYHDVLDWLGQRTRVVRVMPFLEGLPCSIHGWVTATGVAVFLPVEILILRRIDQTGFEYAGVATVWDAPTPVKESMRELSRKVGTYLAREVGYLGPYGVDGILTPDGFRPTELNPRMSAGAGVQLGVVDVPLGLLMRAEIEGLVQVDHEWLEEIAIGQRKPAFHFGKMVSKEVRDTMWVGLDESGNVVEAGSAEDSIGKITAGPAATGSYVTGEFQLEKLRPGAPVGAQVAASLNLANGKWRLGLPELAAAPVL